jgi:peptide/nickel transport system substrate-binding protein
MTAVRLSAALALALSALAGPGAMAQERGGVVSVATVGDEPPTLDPMVSTGDLVGMVTQHFFETLYTFDKSWKVTPLLAAAMPDLSEDGNVYTIRLRDGVSFHDGSHMTSADVVASLKRWMGHEVACIRWEETGAFAGTSSPASARPLL